MSYKFADFGRERHLVVKLGLFALSPVLVVTGTVAGWYVMQLFKGIAALLA